MLALISPLVVRGVIDNTLRDRISLELWVQGSAEPLRLNMRGNCWQDIAGCRVEFDNGLAKEPAAGADEAEIVQILRTHVAEGKKIFAGDITLSRRARHGAVVHNLLSVEFFVEARIRVLLQSVKFRFRITRGSWRLTPEEEGAQRFFNREVMHEHVLYSVRHFRGAAVALTAPSFPLCHWDACLNRAEAYMSIIPTLQEKYRGQPGAYLTEAYLVDRTDILTQAAEEEDVYGHGAAERHRHHWEMVDFVEPEYVDEVTQAMHHPLFLDTSLMTEAVREHIINEAGKAVAREAAQAFLTLYSGVVSHILATILLTHEDEYSAAIAARRIDNLRQRLATLGEGIDTLQPAQRRPLSLALGTLTSSLASFCSSLRRG